MTRIWNCTETFPGKVNFVDSNNVLLGYDLYQSDAEYASWSISNTKDGANPLFEGDDSESKEIEIPGYVFDDSFFEYGEIGFSAIFKLVDINYVKPDLYVRLENDHNGYYGHGFAFKGASEVLSGNL